MYKYIGTRGVVLLYAAKNKKKVTIVVIFYYLEDRISYIGRIQSLYQPDLLFEKTKFSLR